MRWFTNLNATPRLMISFGALMALTLGMSLLAINSLSKSNDRIDTLYHHEMIGMDHANGITIEVATSARLALHSVVHSTEPAVIAQDEKDALAAIADLHQHLDEADKLFSDAKGRDQLMIVRRNLSNYEQAQTEVFQALKAHDFETARKRIDEVSQIRTEMRAASDTARMIKQERAEEAYQTNTREYQSSRTLLLTAAFLSLALGVILSLVIARGFSVPLGMAVRILEKVAGGDLTASLDVETKDEVGRMAVALNKTVEKLRETLQEVADSASNASSSSQQLAAASETIASGAQEQAASLEETSASLEEITATVRQSADNAQQASQLAASSKDSAEHGQEVVASAITAMAEINAASAKISDIISTIDEIAFQTNLLAVNAAVEAARAGEEGRGFAVVASEVRSLAQRSAVAAKEIKGLIQDSLRKVEAGSDLVNRSGETLQTIVGSVKRVTDIVGEIAAAAAEQSTGIEQVNTAMTQMDQVTQANSAQTEELSATAQSLSEQSARLLEMISAFTLSKGNGRDRYAYQARGTSSASSDFEARPSAVSARSAAKPTWSATNSKAGTKPRASNKGAQPTLAMASATGANDSNFEEF